MTIIKGISLVAQLVKNTLTNWETWVQSLGWEDPLEKGKVIHSSFWPREFHGLYSPWGRKKSDMTAQLSHSLFTLWHRRSNKKTLLH